MAAGTKNARSQNVERRVDSMTRVDVAADRRCQQASVSAVYCVSVSMIAQHYLDNSERKHVILFNLGCIYAGQP